MHRTTAILAALVALMAATLVLFPEVAIAREEEQGASAHTTTTAQRVVAPNDSLWSISEERLGPGAPPERVALEVQRIHDLNRTQIGEDPGLIRPGQKLLLPPISQPPPRPALEEKPIPRPALEEKPAPRPALEEKPIPRPALEEKPIPRPALEEKPTPRPAGGFGGAALERGKSLGLSLLALINQPKTYLATVLVVLIALYVYALAVVSALTRARGERKLDDLFFVLLVPALNEERVIGRTLTSLLALHGNFLVLVIDDGSDDGTVAAVAPFLSDPRVQLLQQPPERARRGKGHVLNAGYAAVRRLKLVERYGPQNVIVTVFDSDARVEPNFLRSVSSHFQDPGVAGVQSAVRMYNASHNTLTLWQHLEFAIWGKVLCRAKNLLGSATLGGNGQCVRLSALTNLGPEPWEASSLTEDLDLSLRLLIDGWRLRFCPSVSVSQEAVPRLGRLVRQRSRWMQGHLVCWRYLPDLLRARLPVYARLDLILFLLLPAAIIPVGLASIGSWSYFLLSFGRWGAWDLLAWYALGFVAAPLAMASLRLEGHRLWRSVLQGHLFVFYSFVWFLAGFAACWNVLLGRRAWAKTGRVKVEPAAQPPIPATSPLVSEQELANVRRLFKDKEAS